MNKFASRFTAYLDQRVVDHAAAPDEARAEDRIPAFVQHVPVANHVAAIVRFVGHHDHHRIALHVIEPVNDRAAEAVTGRHSGSGRRLGQAFA